MAEFTTDINKIYSENNILTHLPERYFDDCIYLLVRDPYYIFSYWEIKDETKNEYTARLGDDAKLTLRVFKVRPSSQNEIFTDIHNIWDVSSYHINVNSPNTPFFVQIGYLKDNVFHPVMTSNLVVTPRDNYSDALDEDWMAVEEYYRGLRKVSFDIHGSPFIERKNSLVMSGKRERVSSRFLKEETSGDTVSSEEIIPIHGAEDKTIEFIEEAEGERATKKARKESFASFDNEILYPKKRENLSKPPDKVTEEPATNEQENYTPEKTKTETPANKPIIKAADIKGADITKTKNPAAKKTAAKAKPAVVKKTAAKKSAPKKTKPAAKKTAIKKTTVKKKK